MFRKIQNLFPHRRTDETGASAVEYGLLIALIAAVIVVAVILLGNTVSGLFSNTSNCVDNKSSTACTNPS